MQICTSNMHEVAESGIAAHWMYKEQSHENNNGNNYAAASSSNKNPEKDGARFAWLRELVEEVRRQSDPKEFVKSVKDDLFSKEVFVFSLKGDLYALARGSSVLDFGECKLFGFVASLFSA